MHLIMHLIMHLMKCQGESDTLERMVLEKLNSTGNNLLFLLIRWREWRWLLIFGRKFWAFCFFFYWLYSVKIKYHITSVGIFFWASLAKIEIELSWAGLFSNTWYDCWAELKLSLLSLLNSQDLHLYNVESTYYLYDIFLVVRFFNTVDGGKETNSFSRISSWEALFINDFN